MGLAGRQRADEGEPRSYTGIKTKETLRMGIEEKLNDAAFEYYSRLRRVKDYVEQHLSDDLSLKRAASIAGVGEKYFSTFFHAKTGVCYRDWVASVRVQRAMQIFEATNHPVIGVCSLVGFRDLRTFQRAFKKQTGMTPLEYKKSVRPC